jgi:hypothetical protein
MIRGKKDRPKPKIRRAPFIAILLSIIVGAVGISLDEPLRVLEQAKQICLACIGIG